LTAGNETWFPGHVRRTREPVHPGHGRPAGRGC